MRTKGTCSNSHAPSTSLSGIEPNISEGPEYETSSTMGNDRSPGSQHNVWRHHDLECSKAGNSELETVVRNKFKHSRYYASSGYLQVLERSE